jgi:hypothetical protein
MYQRLIQLDAPIASFALIPYAYRKAHWPGLSNLPERILGVYRVEVVRLRQQLEPLEAGVLQLGGRRRPKGRWKDITERQILYLRNGIAAYERSIMDLLGEIDNA